MSAKCRKSVSPSAVDRSGAEWRGYYYQLLAFHRERGHCDVPAQSPMYRGLAAWIETQRRLHGGGRLAEERRELLAELGLDLNPAGDTGEQSRAAGRQRGHDKAWNRRFKMLKAFKRRFGHMFVPKRWAEGPSLGNWVQLQRHHRRKGILLPNRAARLSALGFVWDPDRPALEMLWERRYRELLLYKERFGHTRVPAGWKENASLGAWHFHQRKLQRTGKLSAERIRMLEAIGFEWDAQPWLQRSRMEQTAETWQRYYQELITFRERFGHCRVPSSSQESRALAKWVTLQRQQYLDGKLSAERSDRLEALGFVWKPGRIALDVLWERRFAELTEYHRRFGHTHVPAKWKENPVLGSWHWQQRKLRRDGTLSAERIAKLEALGFDWADPECENRNRREYLMDLWDQHFEEVMEFRKRFGHTRVPGTWPENPALGRWVQKMRDAFREGRLHPDRLRELQAIGFMWEPEGEWQRVQWDQRFGELTGFHRRFGHTLVPARWPENAPLGSWCYQQRKLRKGGKLAADRIARLETLGFEWDIEVAGRHRRAGHG